MYHHVLCIINGHLTSSTNVTTTHISIYSDMMKYILLHQQFARFACRWWAWLRSKMICSSPGAGVRLQIAAKRGSANSLISSGLFFIIVQGLFCVCVVQVLLDCYFYTLTSCHQHNINIPFCPFFCTWLRELAAGKWPNFPQPDSWSVEILSDMRHLSPLRSKKICVTNHGTSASYKKWIEMKQSKLVNKCNRFKPLRWMPSHPPGTLAQHHQQAATLDKKHTQEKKQPWGRQLAAPPDFLGPHSQAAWAMPAASSHDLQI